jgi:hypothetical protein
MFEIENTVKIDAIYDRVVENYAAQVFWLLVISGLDSGRERVSLLMGYASLAVHNRSKMPKKHGRGKR